MNKEEIIEEAPTNTEDREFGAFWQEVDREDLTIIICDWVEAEQGWLVKVRAIDCVLVANQLICQELNQQGNLIGVKHATLWADIAVTRDDQSLAISRGKASLFC